MCDNSLPFTQLLFHVDNGAGRITAEHVPEGEGFCDGRWHSVTANKLRHRVELVVDGKKSLAESSNARSNTCDTSDPLYVGGYPGMTAFLHKHARQLKGYRFTSVSS